MSPKGLAPIPGKLCKRWKKDLIIVKKPGSGMQLFHFFPELPDAKRYDRFHLHHHLRELFQAFPAFCLGFHFPDISVNGFDAHGINRGF